MASKRMFTLAALATTVLAQDAQTTLIIPFGETGSDGFVASVQAADACDTTLIVGCASTDSPNAVCQSVTDLEATVVVGPTGYEFRYAISTLGGTGLVSQTCELEGPVTAATSAVCTASLSINAGDVSTGTSTTLTVGESDINYASIPITAGASKLPSTGATCTATAGSGSGSGGAVPSETSAGGAAATNMVKSVVKVLVPVAAIAGALV